MSGEADITKSRSNINSTGGKNFSRSFKKRFFQNKNYNSSSLVEKIYLMQAEALNVQQFTSQIELALKQQENQLKKAVQNSLKINPFLETNLKTKPKIIPSASTSSSSSSSSGGLGAASIKLPAEPPIDPENPFDKGLKSLKSGNTLVVIRGLVGLLLGMDFTCNMDLFLLTCKVIARLVSACQPAIQLSKIMTSCQLQQLIRIAVWKDQQQPWAVHAITCLLQDILEADKNFKEANISNQNSPSTSSDILSSNDDDEAAGTSANGLFVFYYIFLLLVLCI